MKVPLFAVIQDDDCFNPASIVDLNRDGVGFCLACKERELTGEIIVLDLVSDGNRIVLRALSALVVYARPINQHENDPGHAPKRYGLKFVNLSDLEKRMLDLIGRKYSQPPNNS